MKYKQLGRTGLFVSEFCLGTMTLGGNADAGIWKAIGGLGQPEADDLIRHAVQAGINFIDTADVYSFGQSERLVGQALRNLDIKRSDVVLSTKTSAPVGTRPNDQGASRGHIMDSVQCSLERLQTDHIDLYHIHADDPVTPIEETLRAIDDLIRQGLVRYAGVSNWRAGKIGKALGLSASGNTARLETAQVYYSIAGRDIERELVPLAVDEKLSLLVWSPLAGGLLSGKFGPGTPENQNSRRATFDFPPIDKDRAWACVAQMRAIGETRGATVAQVALAWLLAQPHVTSVIVGAKRVEQLDENLRASEIELSSEEITRLNAISQLPDEYPGWMIEHQTSGRFPKDSSADA
ncbi:aldo/keto reductase [Pseudomonas sp. NPDC089569]|uniref:aldo/keto reductase n=1 Tax=Pseudomonas sp. NPDC089569 TaxID=3390722 RepID=UPI003CFBCFBD